MIRACTGFDGGSEVEEAIRGAGPRINPYLNINADCLSHRLQRGEALRFQSFEGMEEFMKLLK